MMQSDIILTLDSEIFASIQPLFAAVYSPQIVQILLYKMDVLMAKTPGPKV